MSTSTLLSNRYTYERDSKSVYPNTPERREGISRLLLKLEQGEYRLEDVPCPCGAHEDEILACRDRFAIPMRTVICRSCGLVRINPRMDESSYARFYNEEFRDIATLEKYPDKGERVTAIHEKERTAARLVYEFITSTPGVQGFADPDRPKARVADMGCGSGGMVRYFADKGHPAAGCDYDSEFVEHGRSQGLDLLVGNADTLMAKGPFDVVLLSHVFEHVTSPFAMLDSLAQIMQPSSLLYIELPGILDISMGRYRNDFLRYLRFVHTFSFSLATLTNVMESRGFRLLRGDEWIHAVFVYQGTSPQPMRPLRAEYEKITRYLRRIERRRWLYPAFAAYVTWRRSVIGSGVVSILDAFGLKKSLKSMLRWG